MKSRITGSAVLIAAAIAITAPNGMAQAKHQNVVIDIWATGKPVFGVFATTEGQPLPGQPVAQRGGGGGGRGQAPPAQGQRGGPPNPAQIRAQIATLQAQLQEVEAAAARGSAPAAAPRPDLGYSKAIGEALARNPLYDFVFLNLEEAFTPEAVKNMAEGLRSPGASSRKTLIVRIPPIHDAGADKTKVTVKQAFDNGADGVTIPDITSLEEAKLAISFFANAVGANNVWSPRNPSGEKLGMIMVEDPGSLMQIKQIVDLPGYSIMACGIGSMGGAIRQTFGDASTPLAGQLADIATLKILEESKRVKVANMLTANPNDIVNRVNQGFTALLLSGPTADDAIKLGRLAAGRQ